MITQTELEISNKSYIKKDFYQCYPELVDLAKKLSNRWDPQYANESDPGIVLLKLMAFTADKINYNIDKNILEAFMPSVTQYESMVKLCSMMGYNIGYYESAVTDVSFMCQSSELVTQDKNATKYIELPAFSTVITDEAKEVVYTLIQPVLLKYKNEVVVGQAMEGQYVELNINSDNLLVAANLDDNNRFYLPESMIAKNGIWIKDPSKSDGEWKRVDNLNTQPKGSLVWQFGYDSKLNKPYIQFPEDALSLMTNGLSVGYIRTNGINGNISAKTLSTLQNTTLPVLTGFGVQATDDDGQAISIECNKDTLVIQNASAATNGRDIETIDEAYNGFKKTIGTFDTLITTRDYANYIYNLLSENSANSIPLVSNIQVSDLKDDINKSSVIATFDSYGISYDVCPEQIFVSKPVSGNYFIKNGDEYTPVNSILVAEDAISNFDLYLYPLNPITDNTSKDQYKQSFLPNSYNFYEIKNQIDDSRCLAHSIKRATSPEDLYLIKNYYSLSAKINTSYKVNVYEISQIKNNIYKALFKNFNSRKLEYGKEISYDLLEEVIQNADARIKSIALDEPEIETWYCLASPKNGIQEGILSYLNSSAGEIGKDLYLKLAAKNILAGRLPLFNYNKDFNITYNQTGNITNKIFGKPQTYIQDEAEVESDTDLSITGIGTNLKLNISPDSGSSGSKSYTLRENELVQLISPKLSSEVTYPVYVNYYFEKGSWTNGATEKDSTPALMCKVNTTELISQQRLIHLADWNYPVKPTTKDATVKKELFTKFIDKYKSGALSTLGGNLYVRSTSPQYNRSCGYLVDSNYYLYTIFGSVNSTGFTVSGSDSYAYIPAIKDYEIIKCTMATYSGTNFFETVATDHYKWLVKENSSATARVIYADSIFNSESYDFNTTDQNFATFVGKEVDKIQFTRSGLIDLGLKETSESGVFETDYVTTNSQSIKGVTSYDTALGAKITDGYINPVNLGECQVVTKTKYIVRLLNVGSDAILNKIPKGTEYKLTGDDHLYIQYTDDDEVTYNLEYTATKRKINGADVSKSSWNAGYNIIKPNFDLYDSRDWARNHTWTKTNSGTNLIWNSNEVPGLFSLGTSDELAIRDFAKTKLEETSFIYWITNRNNQLHFDWVSGNVGDYGYFSYILDDGEYLLYTNSVKTQLITFGSGSKLTLRKKVTSTSKTYGITWTLRNNVDVVGIDSISSKGIGAFAEGDWIAQQFNVDEYLEIQQMNIITLTEGDIIQGIVIKDAGDNLTKIDSFGPCASTDIIPVYDDTPKLIGYDLSSPRQTVNNGWWSLNTSKFKYNGKELNDYMNFATTESSWMIRPLLNINVGPSTTQILKNFKDSGDVVMSEQEMFVFGSEYRYISGEHTGEIVPSDTVIQMLADGSNDLEEIIFDGSSSTKKPIVTYKGVTNENGLSIKSNKLLQHLGSTCINTHTKSISGSQLDDFKVYSFKKDSAHIQYNSGESVAELPINSYKKEFTKLSAGKTQLASLPVFIPENNYGLVSVYYTPSDINNYVDSLGIQPGSKDKELIITLRYKDGRSCWVKFNYESETDPDYTTNNPDIIKVNIDRNPNNPTEVELKIEYTKTSKKNVGHIRKWINNYTDVLVKLDSTTSRWSISLEEEFIGVEESSISCCDGVTIDTTITTGLALNLLKKLNSISDIIEDSSDTYTSSVTLSAGLNIIKVKCADAEQEPYLIVDCSKDNGGVITLADLNIVSVSGNDDGINTKLLGVDDSGAAKLLDKIEQLDSDNKFYYNLSIANEDYLDVDTLDDPYSWFNKNNIANKFVLAELDTDSFENIEIAKASRLVK